MKLWFIYEQIDELSHDTYEMSFKKRYSNLLGSSSFHALLHIALIDVVALKLEFVFMLFFLS